MPGPEQDHDARELARSDTKETVHVSADYTIQPHETMVAVTIPPDVDQTPVDIVMALPNTGAANGRGYIVYVEAVLGTGTVEALMPEDGIQGATVINPSAMTALGDCWAIQNWGGRFWELCVDDVTPPG